MRVQITIADMEMRRRVAQKNYDKGFFRFVLTRAAAFGSALFVLNVCLMLGSRNMTARNLETAALICVCGGIVLGVGRWLTVLRLLRNKLYS